MESFYHVQREKSEQRCAQCPLVWYNNLAQEINGVSVSKAQGIILKSLERLDAKEKESILAKMSGAETTELSEQNQVLMMLLKVSCEVKQDSHEVDLIQYSPMFNRNISSTLAPPWLPPSAPSLPARSSSCWRPSSPPRDRWRRASVAS